MLEGYGVDSDDEGQKQYATNCLLARRMVERGVRFVLMMDASWDDHSGLNQNLPKRCRKVDQSNAYLIQDLKQRGLLDETLVIWGGEFGRTPMVEMRRPDDADGAGRDHHPNAYSMWMAGGGLRSGQVLGKTDDLCLNVVEDPVHVHDLQATVLHLLGFDHKKLTYRHMGRDFRLTDVSGRVVTSSWLRRAVLRRSGSLRCSRLSPGPANNGSLCDVCQRERRRESRGYRDPMRSRGRVGLLDAHGRFTPARA